MSELFSPSDNWGSNDEYPQPELFSVNNLSDGDGSCHKLYELIKDQVSKIKISKPKIDLSQIRELGRCEDEISDGMLWEEELDYCRQLQKYLNRSLVVYEASFASASHEVAWCLGDRIVIWFDWYRGKVIKTPDTRNWYQKILFSRPKDAWLRDPSWRIRIEIVGDRYLATSFDYNVSEAIVNYLDGNILD